MSSIITKLDVEPWRDGLGLPIYRVGEAARYAGISAQTVSYWRRLSNRLEPPSGPGKRRDLSYFDLVEVAFVATFRNLGMPFKRIRIVHDYAAERFGSKHPFAQYKWFTEGHHVLLKLREVNDHPPTGHLVAADAHGQIQWRGLMGERFAEFDYEQDIALVWHVAGRESPVKIDPRMSFGTPTVRGLPTWVLKDRYEAGESIPSISEDYGLSEEDVRHGLDFEGVLPEA